MSLIDEDQAEQATLEWFVSLGYQRAFGPDLAPGGKCQERDAYRNVVLVERLRSALARINPAIPASARDDALQRVVFPDALGLTQQNRQFHRSLTDGVAVEYNKGNDTLGDRVKLIDFNNPANNDWLVVNQFAIEGPKQTRRPDVILFVNGLPLAVLELKNPADENADIWSAYHQFQTYKLDIPDLFIYNEVLVISDFTRARMGSLTSDQERFSAWRTIDGETLDPLGDYQQLETLIRGVFHKQTFLEFLRHFVLFEDDGAVKKIAGYHQFHAVRAVVQSVILASRPGGNRRGGVVWHTQGSGKSIEMSCLAGRLMMEPAMANPTIVVVTDRNDLDGQLFATFSGASELLRETPTQAESRPKLRELLANRPSGGIVFTTIQKFQPGEDEDAFPMLSDRANIVVICDEAHRTQYGFKARIVSPTKTSAKKATPANVVQEVSPGYLEHAANSIKYGYAQHLRDALPNATFVAFTGTPVSSEDRDTRAVFGDYVHIYDIEQAVTDGATVRLYYESRLAKLELKPEETPHLDAEIEELTEDEEETAKAHSLRRWAALEKLVGSPPRIAQVAKDMVAHFETRQSTQEGKAMVVAMSREVCVHLYDALVALRPEWHDDDPEKGAIKVIMTGSASDKAILKPHVHPKDVKKRLEKRFRDPADPLKIVIVRDMWLTGFDAPCANTMYIDKPMKGHNLMQAIARVNRVFKDKPGGLVVDYIGIATELKQALKEYTNSNGKGTPTIDADVALMQLKTRMDVIEGRLHGFDYSAFRTKALQLLAGTANYILGLEPDSKGRDGKKWFADEVLTASKAFALCCTLDEAKIYRDQLAFFQAVKSALIKHDTQHSKLSEEAKEHALRQIISGAVVSDGVIDIFAAAGLDKPEIGILSPEFLEDVRHMKERNLAVELLERLLKDEIKSRFSTNVVQNVKFSELLMASLQRYRNRAIETAQVIEELIAMAKEFNAAAKRGEQLGLNQNEVAFYDALETNEASVRDLGDETLKKIARELTDYLRRNVTVDWSVRDSVRAKLRGQVKLILKRYKYPPDMEARAIELVLKQAEALSESFV